MTMDDSLEVFLPRRSGAVGVTSSTANEPRPGSGCSIFVQDELFLSTSIASVTVEIRRDAGTRRL